MVLSKGVLIGATASGGSANYGTVFTFDTKTGVEQVLHSFSGADGQTPQYPPTMADDGTLYGTTSIGGKSNDGVVYKLDQHSGVEKVLFNFDGSDGANPNALTIGPDGLLYATSQGGGINFGNLFTLDPKAGKQTVLYTFSENDHGYSPTYGVVLGQGGLIYGTGTVDAFEFNPSTDTMTDLGVYADGLEPSGGLVLGSSGNLYGVAQTPSSAAGRAFRFDIATQQPSILWTFDGLKPHGGYYPFGVVFGKDGNLYGTTEYSKLKGKPAYGTIFSLAP
jgi:uncharacterized repeat protein (TIGR03803 family)